MRYQEQQLSGGRQNQKNRYDKIKNPYCNAEIHESVNKSQTCQILPFVITVPESGSTAAPPFTFIFIVVGTLLVKYFSVNRNRKVKDDGHFPIR